MKKNTRGLFLNIKKHCIFVVVEPHVKKGTKICPVKKAAIYRKGLTYEF
jgi:hypothetical protein